MGWGLPLVALGWAIGVGFAGALGLGPAVALPMVVLGVGGLCRGWRLCALCLAATAGGVISVASTLHPVLPACHVARHTGRVAVQLQGRVAGPATRTSDGTRQRLRALGWRTTGAWVPLCGHVELRRPSGVRPLPRGETVMLLGALRPARGPRNPGVAGPQLRFVSRDIGAVVYSGAEPAVAVIGPPPIPGPMVGLERLRADLGRTVEAALPPSPGRAVLLALVVGQRHELDRAQRRRFARAGISHLLAVSGLHLSLVALSIFALIGGALRRVSWVARRDDPQRLAALIAIVAALGYTMLTGAAPATVRACTMACALLAGRWVRRPVDWARPFALAALLLLVADPLNLFRPGFQLSFLATAAIALWLRGARGMRPGNRWRRLGRALVGLWGVTLAATALTAPVVAHHFGEISVAGLATNLVAVPLTTLLLLPCALVGVVVAHLSGWAGPLEVAWTLAQGLDQLCRWVASVPLVGLPFRPDWWVTAGCCLLVVSCLWRDRGGGGAAGRQGRWRRRLAGLGLALLGGVLALRLARPAALEVTFVDVGQGDATFLRFPDGTTMLVDGGGRPAGLADPGARRVVPFLRAAGVRRLDLVVASHPHADHVGGLRAVLAGFEVGVLWLCDGPIASRWSRRLRRWARARGVPVRRPRSWVRGAVTVDALWPLGPGASSGRFQGATTCWDPARGVNDNSIVVRLRYGRSTLLLTGDIEGEAEVEIVRRWPASALQATVLKVPHHGSPNSSSEALLQVVRPRLAVVSCGPDNRFAFPHREVLGRLRRVGSEVARVDRRGAIVLRLYRDGDLRWGEGFSLLP